jgi:hypothetical protein
MIVPREPDDHLSNSLWRRNRFFFIGLPQFSLPDAHFDDEHLALYSAAGAKGGQLARGGSFCRVNWPSRWPP